jgi:hypothetical protein
MAWTQADLDRIDAAIAGGAVLKSMTFADQSFEFRDMSDMLKARALIASSLATAAGGSGYRLAATSKGA